MSEFAPKDLESLESALGPELFEAHETLEIEGCSIRATLSPESPESLCKVLEEMSRGSHPALLRGGGTRIALGTLSRGADLMLSTRKLLGGRCFEPDDGVIEVSAGMLVEDVRTQVSAEGWELPLDAGGAQTTVGGVIATAAIGPRCLGFGPVKKNVLGLEVVSASGVKTKCGGRVVKNVTGYDLAKLYTGCLGTLGVISGAWLRLQPRPTALMVRVAEFSESESALRIGLEASRRGSSRACSLLSPEVARSIAVEHSLAASWLLLVEFAGEEAECLQDAKWLEGAARAVDPGELPEREPASWMDALRESRPATQPALRIRITTLPTHVGKALPGLMEAHALLIVQPGLGVIEAEFPTADADGPVPDIAALLAVTRAAAKRCGGSLVIEDVSIWAKRELDVFGEVGPGLEIMKRLKSEFDPQSLLNPGRFVGGI